MQFNISNNKLMYNFFLFFFMLIGIIYQKILRDDNFFETKMKLPLEKFYFEAMLPELIDSRIDRNRCLRD